MSVMRYGPKGAYIELPITGPANLSPSYGPIPVAPTQINVLRLPTDLVWGVEGRVDPSQHAVTYVYVVPVIRYLHVDYMNQLDLGPQWIQDQICMDAKEIQNRAGMIPKPKPPEIIIEVQL